MPTIEALSRPPEGFGIDFDPQAQEYVSSQLVNTQAVEESLTFLSEKMYASLFPDRSSVMLFHNTAGNPFDFPFNLTRFANENGFNGLVQVRIALQRQSANQYPLAKRFLREDQTLRELRTLALIGVSKNSGDDVCVYPGIYMITSSGRPYYQHWMAHSRIFLGKAKWLDSEYESQRFQLSRMSAYWAELLNMLETYVDSFFNT